MIIDEVIKNLKGLYWDAVNCVEPAKLSALEFAIEALMDVKSTREGEMSDGLLPGETREDLAEVVA